MRYLKNSILLSASADQPLLRYVLNSGCITHNQLFEFLKLDYCASSRDAFNNRVLRLVRHGLLSRHRMPLTQHEMIYSVSQAGALRLVSGGEYCLPRTASGSCTNRRMPIHHCLDLNEIHLAIKRSGSLVHWMSEPEIRSRADLGGTGFCKYYDAIVVVRLGGQDCKFAVELERTPKAARHYAMIRERIEQESAVAHFVYLAPNYDLLSFVADKLRGCNRAIYFCLLKDFLEHTMMAPVRRSGAHFSVILATALSQGKATPKTGTLFVDIAI